MAYRNLAVTAGTFGLLAGLAGCDLTSLLSGLQPQSQDDPQNARVQPGDYWSYSDWQIISSEDPPFVRTTQYTRTFTDETVTDLAGQTAWTFKTEGTTSRNGSPPEAFSSSDYNSSDETGMLYTHGDLVETEDGGYASFVLAEFGGKFKTKPYPLAVGATYSWDATYDDGYRRWGSASITAYEEITTPAGTFMAARIESEEISSFKDSTTTWTIVRWHAPRVAQNVKYEGTCHQESSEGIYDWSEGSELTGSNLLTEKR